MDINTLLHIAIENKASDLHLSAETAPLLRIDGDLRKLNLPCLNHEQIMHWLEALMDKRLQDNFARAQSVDFSYENNLGRFRINVFMQARGVSAAFRIIPFAIPTIDSLGLPLVLQEIATLTQGLVLITGPTGSGKSSTLAALINFINITRFYHILTIEDPIEFIHQSHNCLVNQRELHRDIVCLSSALRSALRADFDVILIGELRDSETIRLAITAAETGHLVFASLHTNSAAKAINRIIDIFSGNEKAAVRSLLAESLQAVVAQNLLKRVQGNGRVLAVEIMICNAAIRNLIREDKIAQIYTLLQTSKLQGMQTLDQHLLELHKNGFITAQTAREVAVNKAMFNDTFS